MASLPGKAGFAPLEGSIEDIDPELCRGSELAAEDIGVVFEESRGWECKRVGHLELDFNVRSMVPSAPQVGYRDPGSDIRRIEVKGRLP